MLVFPNIMFEALKWIVITAVIHELSHIIAALIRKDFAGLVLGFIEGKWYKLVMGLVAEKYDIFTIISPQIVVPLIYVLLWWLGAMNELILIATIVANAASSIQDFKVLKEKSKGNLKPVPFYGIALFFNPLRIEKGWL